MLKHTRPNGFSQPHVLKTIDESTTVVDAGRSETVLPQSATAHLSPYPPPAFARGHISESGLYLPLRGPPTTGKNVKIEDGVSLDSKATYSDRLQSKNPMTDGSRRIERVQ